MEALDSFENDDYAYLINDNHLITTCQEALEENNNFDNFDADQSLGTVVVVVEPTKGGVVVGGGNAGGGDNLKPININNSHGQLYLNCDENSSIRSPSSAASSGLGLSQEEDLSLKYCHSDEEFSSINSNNSASESNFSEKALLADFDNWLEYIETQLDAMCLCANNPTTTTATTTGANNNDNHSDAKLHTLEPSSNLCSQQRQQQQRQQQEPTVDIDRVKEEEEWMMSLTPFVATSTTKMLAVTTTTSSGNNKVATINAAKQLLSQEDNTNEWIKLRDGHKALHADINKVAHKFLQQIKELKANYRDSVERTLPAKLQTREDRCHDLLYKSWEYIVILEQYCKRCPRHFQLNRPPKESQPPVITDSSPESIAPLTSSHHPTSFASLSTNNPLLSRSYNSIFTQAKYSKILHLLTKSRAYLNNRSSPKLCSTGIGSASVLLHNRRVQTLATGTGNMNESTTSSSGSSDAHSHDGSGSPTSGDSGIFSPSLEKFDIIQKDIGYSSDADMSDAIEVHPQSDQNSQRLVRKHKVRRRRTRTTRTATRPWSFHADWTDWDYYQTPFASNAELVNNEDTLNYDDHLRHLTEFGENYEAWINADLDGIDDTRVDQPAVVLENVEETVAAAAANETTDTIGTASFQDASTSPIPFEVDEQEVEGEKKKKVKPTKSTQTLKEKNVEAKQQQQQQQQQQAPSCATCSSCKAAQAKANDTKGYSSFKFYKSLAVAGLVAILFAVTQFPPEIHKTYSRPPPL